MTDNKKVAMQLENPDLHEGLVEKRDSFSVQGKSEDEELSNTMGEMNDEYEDHSIPGSTPSKIIVSMIDYKDGSFKATSNKDFKYKIDIFDKLRLRLLEDDDKMWNRFKKMMDTIEKNKKYHPWRRSVPCLLSLIIGLILFSVVMVILYFLLLVIQLALFNLVIIGICLMFARLIILRFVSMFESFKNNYKSFYLNMYLKSENRFYRRYNMKITAHPAGLYLSVALLDKKSNF
jgi:hypothetical protein